MSASYDTAQSAPHRIDATTPPAQPRLLERLVQHVLPQHLPLSDDVSGNAPRE